MSERYVPDRLVTVGEIAKIAGVFPSAVSNWRGRNQAFPQPRESTSGSDRFLLTEVIEWLDRTGREYQLPADTDELLRDWVALVSGSHTRFSAIEQGIEVLAIRAHAKPKVWSDLVGAEPSDILSRLRVAALSAGAACDGLTRFATEQLYEAREGDWTSFTPAEIRHLVDAVNALQREQFGEVATLLIDQLAHDKTAGAHATPPTLSELLGRLGPKAAEKVVDPAAGTATTLVRAALHTGASAALGGEIDPKVAWIASLHLAACDIEGHVLPVDAFDEPIDSDCEFVVTVPPAGMRAGPNYNVMDPRWHFGAAPSSNLDLAWWQVVLDLIADDGIGVIGTSPEALSRGGKEARIRERILSEALVSTVVLLPGRLLHETSTPVAVVVFHAHRADRDHVLMIDARELGTPNRGGVTTLASDEVEWIAKTHHRWTEGRAPEDNGKGLAIVVPNSEIRASGANLSPAMYVLESKGVTEIDGEPLDQRLRRLMGLLSESQSQVADGVEMLLTAEDLAIEGEPPLVSLESILDSKPLVGVPHKDPAGQAGVPFIADDDLATTGLRFGGPVTRETSARRASSRLARKGDLLLHRQVGAGQAVVVTFEGEEAAYDRTLIRLRIDEAKALPEYVALFLNTRGGLELLERASAGTTARLLRGDELAAVRLPLPDPATQRRIVEELGRVMTASDELRKLADTAEDVAVTVAEQTFSNMHKQGELK